MTIEKTPTILEDNSQVFKQIRLSCDSVWVDEDIHTITNNPGPFNVFVTWFNEDDFRLRSEGIQNAALTAISGQGALEGGAQNWTLTFEGLSR